MQFWIVTYAPPLWGNCCGSRLQSCCLSAIERYDPFLQDAVTLAVVRPQFRAFASLPLRQAVSGTWARNQLFLLTPDSLVVAFAAAGGGGGRIIGLGGTNDPFLEV